MRFFNDNYLTIPDGLFGVDIPGVDDAIDIGKDVLAGVGIGESRGTRSGKKGLEAFQNITPPKFEPLRYHKYETAGDARDFVTNANDSVAGRNAQLSALSKYRDIINGNGLGAQDRAQLDQINRSTNLQENANRQALMQNAQRRGLASSGFDLFNSLQSNQSIGDRRAQQGLQLSGMAQDRNMQALGAYGNAAGNLRGQDNSIAQFNAAQRTGAGLQDFANRQRVADVNTGNKNNQMIDARRTVPQNEFNNAMAHASGLAGQYQNVGQMQDRGADRLNNLAAAAIQSMSPGGGGGGLPAAPQSVSGGKYL
jgi:hypothetical protein